MMSLWTNDVLKINKALDGKMRLVGGCVRDFILHKEPKDIDIATPLPTDKVIELLEKNRIRVNPICPEYGVVAGVIESQQYEITTLREDIAYPNGRVVSRPTDSYEADTYRRDFTINALSMDQNGSVFDYQNGLQDLEDKNIRFIGVPEERIQEDPLRICRYFRFWADYGSTKPDEHIISLSKQYAIGMKKISNRRRWQEILKVLMTSRVVETLQIMMNINVLTHLIGTQNIDILKLKGVLDHNPMATVLERVRALVNDDAYLKLNEVNFENRRNV